MLYLLNEPRVNPLIYAPVVAFLMRLSRHVTLPIKDAVAFWYVLDQKIYLELKKKHIPQQVVFVDPQLCQRWVEPSLDGPPI